MYENTEQLMTEIEKVDVMFSRFIKSEQALPDEKNQLLWHNAAVEVVAQHAVQEIAQNIQSKLLRGALAPDQLLTEQTIMLEIMGRSMFYAGFQMATDGDKLVPCDCPRFSPNETSEEERQQKLQQYQDEVNAGTRQIGDYL